jgi:hypothetical protein
MNNFFLGVIYMLLAQSGTFIQLQGNARYDWFSKYPIILLLSGIPLTWLYILSTKNMVLAFNGQMWPTRILGFGIGVIVFAFMSHYLFKEPITFKTILCLLLSLIIILIQIFMK